MLLYWLRVGWGWGYWKHTHTHTHTHYTHTHYTHTRTQIRARAHTHAHTTLHTDARARAHTHAHTTPHTHYMLHTHTRARAHTHTHTHTRCSWLVLQITLSSLVGTNDINKNTHSKTRPCLFLLLFFCLWFSLLHFFGFVLTIPRLSSTNIYKDSDWQPRRGLYKFTTNLRHHK